MAQTSFAVMTTLGRAKEAAALANATTITITHIALGDGATVPSGGETVLYHEVARKAISGHGTVAGAANTAYFDCYLAAGDGPYTIREAGLIDSAGDLIAIAHYDPPISKPVPSSGQTVEGTVRLEVAFSDVANVTIVVDPSMQIALQRLTRLPWIPIISMSLATPPVSPVVGDTYLIAAAPTGAWTGQSGKIAEYTVAGWAILSPPNGHGVSLPDGRVFERIGGVYIEKLALDTQSGKWSYAAAGGTANALTVTLAPAPAALTAGMTLRVLIGANGNTGAATLNVNGLGALPIKRMAAGALIAGDLMAWAIVTLIYIDGAWYLAAPSAAALPTGVLTWTSPGTVNWTVPTGVTRIRARVWGGGGGGGSSGASARAGAGGNGGSYAEGVYSVVAGQVLAVTVGAGGAGYVSVSGQDGSPGGTSSVGALLTATGGGGGGGSEQGHAVDGKYGIASGNVGGPTLPGLGSGGQISIGGGYAANASGGGTYPVYGSAGAGAYCSSSSGLSVTGGIGAVYPAGGGGGGANGYGGMAGAPGMVIIEY